MANLTEIAVPDIGDFTDVPIIEVLVAVGDTIAIEDPIVEIESDKASFEVPASVAGVVKEVKVAVGDKVSEGTVLVTVEAEAEAEGEGGGEAPDPPQEPAADEAEASAAEQQPADEAAAATPDEDEGTPGDAGASKDAGAGEDGGDEPAAEPDRAAASGGKSQAGEAPAPQPANAAGEQGSARDQAATGQATRGGAAYASPTVRRLARERGVDLATVQGSGDGGRITKADVDSAEPAGKAAPAAAQPAKAAPTDGDAKTAPTPAPPASSGGEGLGLAPWPKVDFAKFGEIERQPLSRIGKLSAANLARNWVRIPHVTHNDEADITELEAFRKQLNSEQDDVKVTMVALLLKAIAATLREFPRFNASLEGDELVLKHYIHLGFAADTPHGLVVPVVRDVDRKGVLELAAEVSALAEKARAGKLMPAEMSGGTFSLSSLGGIGGTSFTPIINAPEVAILGAVRSVMKPVWNGEAFEPRLMLPLSLSYDHRVIDGASAARFVVHLTKVLADLRRGLL